MKFVFLILFLSLVAGIYADDSNVVDLTPDNFDQIVGQDKPVLVEFFAPWCGHCKNLAPIYEQLADAFVHAKDRVIIAKVDADEHKDLGSRYGVEGFPTLKFFKKDEIKDPEDYSGGRDLESLTSFIEEKTGIKPKIKREVIAVTVLTAQSFDDIALDPEKNALVEFYAPWCGHCKNLAPIYEKVAQDYSQELDCVVANIDATVHKDFGEKYGITGFPTIKFFPKGEDKTPVTYESGRTEQDFVTFLNEHCGTQRMVGGRLTEQAGKIPELDALAARFSRASSQEEIKEILKETEKTAAKLDNRFARYYVKIMEKSKDKDDYPISESTRLDKIIESGTISGKKVDDFTIRRNILASFLKDGGGPAHEEL